MRFVPGELLRVHLTHEQVALTVEGMVARQMGEVLGVKFEVDEASELAARLGGLVSTVERRWLRRERVV